MLNMISTYGIIYGIVEGSILENIFVFLKKDVYRARSKTVVKFLYLIWHF